MAILGIFFSNNVCKEKSHISERIFQTIIKIVKYQTFSKLAVQHPPFTCKPLNIFSIGRKIFVLTFVLSNNLSLIVCRYTMENVVPQVY